MFNAGTWALLSSNHRIQKKKDDLLLLQQ